MNMEDILVRDFVTQYISVWKNMFTAKTDEEFSEAKKFLFGWFDGTRSLDADTRRQVFDQVRGR
jgi:hypothetical protein